MDIEKQQILDRIAEHRRKIGSGDFPSVERRRAMLNRLLKHLLAHKSGLFQALKDDLGKSEHEVITTELMPLAGILKYLIRKLPSLTRPSRLPVSLLNWPAAGYLVQEPTHLLMSARTTRL